MTGTYIIVLVLLTLAIQAWIYLFRYIDNKKEIQQDRQTEQHSQTCTSIAKTVGLTVIPRREHPISCKETSSNAQKVLHRLNSNGYDAYLVGGCIRDLYFNFHPKDFDVATNATPEEVRQLFCNSRVIGRRFKLVHILFDREVIEVATFRASDDQKNHNKDKLYRSNSGRILRDNIYGTIEDDAIRRDFTINALYYDIRNFSVIDYCGGIDDIKNHTLRLIGDPVKRYHEDPVRMMRALRFVAKLNFDMDPGTSDPISNLGHLLNDIPSARLFDEVLKLLQSGSGVKAFRLIRQYGLLQYLFPATNHNLVENFAFTETLIIKALESTDKRIIHGKSVTPAFLFAAMLWTPLKRMIRDLHDQGVPLAQALQQAAMTVIDAQCAYTIIPKRFIIVVRDIWDMQYRLELCQPQSIGILMKHPKFRAAYDFLVLREESGEELNNAGQWWTNIQNSSAKHCNTVIHDLRSQSGSNQKKTQLKISQNS